MTGKSKEITKWSWVDNEGQLHFDIPKLLAVMGVPDTQANREYLTETIMVWLRKECPKATLILTEDE